jgi:hypothetical protein
MNLERVFFVLLNVALSFSLSQHQICRRSF